MNSEIISRLEWRYATKKFDATKKLSEAQLNVLKESFNLTATSYGLQPLKMVVLSDQTTKEKLVPFSMDQPQVKDASHVLVLCIESKITPEYVKSHFKRVEDVRNTPREILQDYEDFLIQDFSEKEHADVVQWMSKQAYIALGNLLTVCALEGIDACPMEGFEPKKYDEVLGLEAHGLQSVLVLPVGYRAEDDMFSGMKKVRRGVSEVIIEM